MRRIALALLCLTGVAHADDVSIQGVKLRLGELGLARFDVTLEVDVPAFTIGSDTVIDLPHGGAITSATVTIAGARHVLALERASDVDQRFDALLDLEGEDVRRTSAARLVAGGGDTAALELIAPEDAHAVIQLSIDAPTCWDTDARLVLVPDAWVPLLGAASPTTCDADVADHSWIRIGDSTLRKRASGASRIGAVGAKLVAGDTSIARIEVALAATLTDTPRDLYTVLVLDESRSVRDDERATERAVIDAYLRAAPRGHVQVVAYARDAQTLLPDWTAASLAGAQIDRALRARPARNGSNVIGALAEASRVLGSVRGTRRIVLLTDERLTSATEARIDTLARMVPSGTIVHIVSPRGYAGLTRDDTISLAPVAQQTEGMAVAAGRESTFDATMLVRPVSLDAIEIVGGGWQTLSQADECGDRVVEGQSCVWTATGSGSVTLNGLLWGRKVTRTVDLDAHRPVGLARILQASALDLPQAVLDDVQRIARTVNSVWSLVAVWNESGGYADYRTSTYGTIGIGSIGSSHDSVCAIDTARGGYDLEVELVAKLRSAIRACTNTTVRVTVELTGNEIANVETDRPCVAEHIWATNLELQMPPEHATLTLRI